MSGFYRNPARWSAGVLMIFTLTLLFGCSEEGTNVNTPTNDIGQDKLLLSSKNPRIRDVMGVQNRHTGSLMEDPTVVGTATGLTEDGEPAIMVYLESEGGGRGVPATIEGVPVVKVVSGRIRMLRGGGGGGQTSGHTARYDRPIPLGVSGGNSKDFAYPYCCSGTLGALVQDGSGTKYMLSNKHVFAGDQAASENDPDVAEPGQEINQPGLIDVNCQDIQADYVGYLTTWCEDNLNIDCAIAEIIPGTVDPAGSILEIGELSAATMDAYVGLLVKKSGRTSGLTRGEVTGINGAFNVGGTDECGGEQTTEYFTGQIVVSGRKFLLGGDSGSLLVEDVAAYPRAVGLLFAGSNTTGIANPIDNVLNYFGVSMIGN